MTRPNIVRADTIDLQDPDSPSAAEHQKPTFQGGLAPHQRAEVHHVLEERTSEEHALADAWKMTDNLADEPEAIDDAQQQHQTVQQAQAAANGVHQGGEEGESEADTDDDMMDRISSSPSIDDGGYTLPSSPPPTQFQMVWPERKSSLSPSPRNTPTPPRETFNESSPSTLGSSPFLRTPQHLPLHLRRTGRVASPLLANLDLSSSPFHSKPKHLPLIRVENADGVAFCSSKHHHSMGRYGAIAPEESTSGANLEPGQDDEGFYEHEQQIPTLSMDCQYLGHTETTVDREEDDDSTSERSVLIHQRDPTETPFRRPVLASHLEESPSLTSIASVDLQDVLLPVDDPLLDIPPSPTDSSSSWESLPTSENEFLDPKLNDDDPDAFFHDLDDRFIDSGWGGECLRETEDIDFEFVYALHTFVATVEGQANATKGDTMVLLDDSNSYWWLVRVVKDSSIGYLPAEHIETPTERLARLNKHRNIDLSQTMLGDNSEKTRNPLKKLRRRNNKTVQFAAPTYVEASDYEYTEDEDDGIIEPYGGTAQSEEAQQNGEHVDGEQAAEKADHEEDAPRSSMSPRNSVDFATVPAVADDPQLSPKLVDKTEAAPLKSRKARNTDSFIKDDTETRKISLTPAALRDPVSGKAGSNESTRNNSLEDLVKTVSPPELGKKDSKKEKEKKKDGVFKTLFGRNKKSKKSKDELDRDEKPSGEYSRESPIVSPSASGRSSPGLDSISHVSNTTQETQSRSPVGDRAQDQTQEQSGAFVAELDGSETASDMVSPPKPAALNIIAAQHEKSKDGPLSPITNILKRGDSNGQKPVKAKKAKQRMKLDDFDTPVEDRSNPMDDLEENDEAAEDDEDEDEEEEERLSESPVEITHNTFMHGTESVHIPTPGPYDQPGVEDDDDEEPESLTSSPSIIEHPAEPVEEGDKDTQEDNDPTPTGPRSPNTASTASEKSNNQLARGLSSASTTASSVTIPSVSQQSWSDSSLRAWLEDGSEIKDMMTMIHDKSGVVPVREDHPLMLGLFTEQKKGVQDMMTQLDGMLGNYLQRKGIAFG